MDISNSNNSKLSDLAKAIKNQQRIPAPYNVSKSVPASATSTINGVVIPKGAVPVMESRHLSCDSKDKKPKGSHVVKYSRSW